jgi:hypothetical protein
LSLEGVYGIKAGLLSGPVRIASQFKFTHVPAHAAGCLVVVENGNRVADMGYMEA